MPPEMLPSYKKKKDGLYSYNADVWSLGVSAIEMITARVPFSEYSNAFAVMFKIAREVRQSLVGV